VSLNRPPVAQQKGISPVAPAVPAQRLAHRQNRGRRADRFAITHTTHWRTIDGDGQGAVIKDHATGRAFIVVGSDPEIAKRVCDAMNFHSPIPPGR
jgi:hypothetical protein